MFFELLGVLLNIIFCDFYNFISCRDDLCKVQYSVWYIIYCYNINVIIIILVLRMSILRCKEVIIYIRLYDLGEIVEFRILGF